MRIIAGKYRRRNLGSPPAGTITRPFPDMVKEAAFNLLRGHIEGEAVLDVFSGTGTIGLEAASRGASRVVMIERDRKVIKVLEENIAMLGAEEECEAVCADALGPAALSRCPKPVHIIFFDPPYAMVRDPKQWPRVKLQFERLVQLLDDTGYAILRLPEPFLHIIETEGEKKAKSAKEKTGPKTETIDGEEMIEIDLESEDAGDALDAFEAALLADAAKAKPVSIDVDITMDGALGPETHAYGTTALHLYMRDPEQNA